jgi:DUF4097 and DUF4098 domain-containing protein YvlB
MRRAILGFLVLGLGLVFMQARVHRSGGVSLATNSDSLSDDCSEHLQGRSGEFPAVVKGEEIRALPNQPLNIHAEHNGGIQVTTWDKAEVSVKLCKQVAASDENEGRKILDETKLAIDGPTISVSVPENRGHYNLSTLLLVKAPRDASVKLKVHNGGASLYRFSGTAEAQTQNGGISLNQSTGKLTVEAQNGGVSIKDCGGDVNATVTNGGLSITLPERWEGKGLEAHTQNGGLVIALPRNFESGLEIASSEHVSIVCRGDACEHAQQTWEGGHRMFRLGSSNPQIRATTQNGGVVIKDREQSRAKM